MRQLKFRIWNRQSKTFVENAAGTHCASRWLIDVFTGRPVDFIVGFEDPEFGSLSEGEDYYIKGIKVAKEPRYVVQQFAGLLDKNGKEIYEGDFLKIPNQSGHFTVKWGQYSWKFTGFTKGLRVNSSWFEIGDYVKVIGNVFENPELVKRNE